MPFVARYLSSISPVKVWLDLEQIAIEGLLALTCLLGSSDEHIKSLQLLDTGKVVNLHKFKMAAVQSLNLQITFLAAFRPYKCITSNVFWLLFIYLLIQEIQNEALQM